MKRLAWGLTLALAACPERAVAERGVSLVYRKPSGEALRSVVDRRLARLKLRANLSEDDSTLTVRLPEGSDVARVKALLAQPAKLEFCAEDAATAARWCERSWPAGVRVENAGRACSVVAATRPELEAALADAGSAFAHGGLPGSAEAWALSSCLSPHVVSAEVHQTPPSLSVELDRAGGRDFAALTTGLVGRRLLIRLDGVVSSAPVVMAPITGGKAMLSTGQRDASALEVLAASLVGGVLPPLVLEREGTWGPPSLRR